jgi:chemotaxis protein CheD
MESGTMLLTVCIGDMKLGHAGDVLVTHALGSCLGLMVYDPVAKLGGLLHAMLPLSSIDPQKAQANPAMFVDTGVPRLFNTLFEQGAQPGRLVVKAAGCGSPMNTSEVFKIGERNYAVLRKLLAKNNILLLTEDVGGSISRTIHFDLASGQIVLSSNGARRAL